MLFPLFPESVQNYIFFFMIMPVILSPFLGILASLKISITDKFWQKIVYILITPIIYILFIPFNIVLFIVILIAYSLGILMGNIATNTSKPKPSS